MPKPFDLELAKQEHRLLMDGEPVQFVAHVPEADESQRVIVLKQNSFISTRGEDGRELGCDHPPLLLADLPPRKVKLWANVYPNLADEQDASIVGWIYKSEKEAKEYAHSRTRVQIIPIEIELPGEWQPSMSNVVKS